jgi:hypothetical protein
MIDLAPPPLWLPAKPAIIRAHQGDLDALKALEREKGIRAMLPGMVPVVAATSLPLTFQFQTSAVDAGGDTMNFPASLLENDLAVVAEYSVLSSTVVPAGFTSIIHSEVSPNVWLIISYKKLNGTESGASLTMSPDVGYGVPRVMLIFRPNKAWSTATAGSWTTSYGGANAPTNRTVTVAGDAPMIILGLKGGTDNAISLAGDPAFTSSVQAHNNSNVMNCRFAYLIYNPPATPANNTVSGVDDNTNNVLSAGYLRMAA